MTENLVLIPGLLCDAQLWAHQAAHLSDLAACMVADITGAETVDELADNVLASAPDHFALAGLSMGGYVAHAIMRRAPGRVRRLALIDTSARPDTPEQLVRRGQLIDMSKYGKFRGVTDRLLPILVHEDRLVETKLTDDIKKMAEHIGSDAFIRQQHAIMSRPDSRPFLIEYGVPTLVMCGRQDALTPLELHREMAAAIPGSRLAVIEDCGHLSTMERPQAATALMRQWLTYN
ncbi:MAG: alpha/beta fold hydrolase [Proteobacteria bacterium]|nr:alpha/beta fold hydrolase [Pseudomonadota bacterium]